MRLVVEVQAVGDQLFDVDFRATIGPAAPIAASTPAFPAVRATAFATIASLARRTAAAFTPLPDVVIITGDITDTGQEAEYANVSAILARTLSIPVFVVPGNHDQRLRPNDGAGDDEGSGTGA